MPGALTQALGITTVLDGSLLTSKLVWIDELGIHLSTKLRLDPESKIK